jgi:hypothetical protein
MSSLTEKLSKTLQSDLGITKNYTESSTTKHVAAYLLQQNLLKKFVDDTSEQEAELAAIRLFREMNSKVADWTPYVAIASDDPVDRIMKRAQKLCADQFLDRDGFPRYTLNHAFNEGGVGPGASIDATEYHIWAKLFKSRLSCTNRTLHTLFKSATHNSFRWEVSELVRAKHYGKVHVVKGSKMFTVPKNRTIARVCFTEPTLNMFGQLGYGTQINKMLKTHHGISIDEQTPINSWFAKSGSLNQEFGTIDLKSASDTIAVKFCEWLLPTRMYKDLMFLRSKHARIPTLNQSIVLHMISTMGNGFTFPLQTWIFANLVLATYIETKTSVFDIYGKRRYGVFGDDIVCDANLYPLLIKVLTASGFIVNEDKSFATGSFRESCGTDFFKGVNVRAVYFKECKSDAHVYGLINRLLMWSGRHKIPLRNTLKYLRGLVKYRPVPLCEDIMAGILTPRRFLTNRNVDSAGHWTYHCLEARHRKVNVEEIDGDLYFHGAVISAIYGSIRSNSYSPRENEEPSYKVVTRSCPISWDYVDDHRKIGIYKSNALTTSEEFNYAFNLNFG